MSLSLSLSGCSYSALGKIIRFKRRRCRFRERVELSRYLRMARASFLGGLTIPSHQRLLKKFHAPSCLLCSWKWEMIRKWVEHDFIWNCELEKALSLASSRSMRFSGWIIFNLHALTVGVTCVVAHKKIIEKWKSDPNPRRAFRRAK